MINKSHEKELNDEETSPNFLVVLSSMMLGIAGPSVAIDLDAIEKEGEAIKQQTENVKKEGTQVKTDAKDLKAKETVTDVDQTKDEATKLKDMVKGFGQTKSASTNPKDVGAGK